MKTTQEIIAESYQPLFNLMQEQHGLTLLQSEMDDIITASQKVVENYNNIQKEAIIEAVCAVYETTFETLNKRSRKREIIEPRQMLMYFLCNYTKLTLKVIGKLFKGKYDHSTVIHNREFITLNLTVNDELYEKYLKICERLKVSGYIKRR
jgi:chromosomal replication initiation ATPase DnaA